MMFSPKNSTFLLIAVLYGVTTMFWGCSRQKKITHTISEGTVSYQISYPTEIEKQPFSFLLPEKMDFHFEPNRVRASFNGSLGLYDFGFISDHHSDSVYTLLKVLDNKMYVISPKEEGLFIFRQLTGATLTMRPDTSRIIAGIEASMATLTTQREPNMVSEIWFTPSVSNNTLYRNTPFEEVPGMMLDFNLRYNSVLFRLRATSVDTLPTPDGLFSVPAGYKKTSLGEIEKMISGLLN